ncbi:MAG: O-antigen ligase family protein [Deltaproteobacteria bacterium]|nr:O-antigen ligase family protein [Deltaproteobacteria bacterium]
MTNGTDNAAAANPLDPAGSVLEKRVLYLFLFTQLFSNLLSRMVDVNLNVVPVAFLLFALIFALKKSGWTAVEVVCIATATVFAVYVFDPRSRFSYNAMSIRDSVIPVLCLFVGVRVAAHGGRMVRFLNWMFLLFVGYGIAQELAFYSGSLGSILPWDAAWLQKMEEGGIWNIYQGPILRFFGVMNTFSEYQNYVAIVSTFLWFNAGMIKGVGRLVLLLNVLLAILFLGLSMERSPIALFLIVLGIWHVRHLGKKSARLLVCVVAGIAVVAAMLLSGLGELEIDPRLSVAYKRLENVLTLNLAKDEAVQERLEKEWRTAADLASEHYLGIGPGRVTQSAKDYERYVAPHNNFLMIFLAYGVVGLLLFGLLLVLILYQTTGLRSSLTYYSFGVTVGYCLLAIFNVPLTLKSGILYFVIAGYLCGVASDRGTDGVAAADGAGEGEAAA